MSIAFGNRLKKLRKAKKLTQKQVAESIGSNQKQYQHWEAGRAEPRFDKIQRLAYVFGVGIEWLVYGKGKFTIHDDNSSPFIKEIQIFLKNNPKALPMMQKMCELFMSEYRSKKRRNAKH